MDNIKAILGRVEVLPMSPSLLPTLLPKLGRCERELRGGRPHHFSGTDAHREIAPDLQQRFFGQQEPVSTVAEAVNRVGYQSIYLLAAMINGSNSFPTPSPGNIDTCKLWKHSVSTGFHSKFAAESAGLDTNLLFTAGLMHDIGKIILAQLIKGKPTVAFNLPTSQESLDAEKMAFGCNHADVGATLLEQWNLPEGLVSCVRHHHAPLNAGEHATIAACVSIGNSLAHEADHPKVTQSEVFVSAMNLLRLDTGHLKRWHRQFDDARDLIAGMSKLPL